MLLGMAKRADTLPGQPPARPVAKNTPPIVDPAIAAKQKATAAKQQEAATIGARAGPLSLGSESSGGPADAGGKTVTDAVTGVTTLGGAGAGLGAGGSAGGNEKVLELDPSTRKQLGGGGQATHRRNIQLHGVDAANRMKAGGGQPGQWNDFWWLNPAQGKQMTADMVSKYLGFNSLPQYTAWQQARSSGMGRALRARANNQWIRSMFQA